MNSLLVAALLALPPLMPVSEVQPGQKGECLTVFEGDDVESMAFSVKGVMRNFVGPNRDLVLIKLEGEKPDFTGVVAGMSGSPCTIDGRLVGALGYSFVLFAKEPIAGVTPMQGMLDVFKLQSTEDPPWRIGGNYALPVRGGEGARAADWRALARGEASTLKVATVMAGGSGSGSGSGSGGGSGNASGELRPIATPLAMGGVLPRVREFFDPWLRSVGFEPVAGGLGGAAGSGGLKPLRPGSTIAAVLVSGDVEMAATGTVTSVEGDQVLAFGHPFFGTGAVSMPMANARVISTMASQMRSFKMALMGEVVGEITQDRLTAVGGYLGRQAKMIPVHGHLNSNGWREPAEFHFDVARDLLLSPRFLSMALANALSGRIEASGSGTVRMSAEIRADGIAPVRLSNVYSAARDNMLFSRAAVDTGAMFDVLWNTPFGPPPKVQVDLDVTYDPTSVEEWVEALHADRGVARPGEVVELAVNLRRDDGPSSVERFHIQVPQAWADQEVQIFAGDDEMASQLVDETQGNPRPTSLADVGRWLSKRRAAGQLYLMAMRQGTGLRARVDSLQFLPPSIAATMSGHATRELRTSGLAWEERRTRPGAVRGQRYVDLRVARY